MNRKFLSSFILTIFLGIQALSLLHMGEYGFKKHEHYGEVCDIYTVVDNNELLSISSAKVITLVQSTDQINLLKEDLFFLSEIDAFEARAPPFLS